MLSSKIPGNMQAGIPDPETGGWLCKRSVRKCIGTENPDKPVFITILPWH